MEYWVFNPKTIVVFSDQRPGREHARNKKFFGFINFKNHDFGAKNLDVKKSKLCIIPSERALGPVKISRKYLSLQSAAISIFYGK
jgi:hypothetical protein